MGKEIDRKHVKKVGFVLKAICIGFDFFSRKLTERVFFFLDVAKLVQLLM